MAVGHIHVDPTDLQSMNLTGQIHTPEGWEEGYIPRRMGRVMIEDPHTNYYSSDDYSIDSGEESDPLN